MTTTLINNIPLPKELRKAWRGSNVVITSKGDSIIVKRAGKITEKNVDVRKKMLEAGKFITKKDLADAIRWARQKA